MTPTPITFKFTCPHCDQAFEAAEPPRDAFLCPACSRFIYPGAIREAAPADLADDLDGFNSLELDEEITSQADSADTAGAFCSAFAWFLLVVGLISSVAVGSDSRRDGESNFAGGAAVFGSFAVLWTIFTVLSRLARIHATIIRLRADGLRARAQTKP